MRYTFIKQEQNSKLLLIFGGWSVEPEFYKSIGTIDFDILVVTDFSTFSFNNSLLEPYDTIVLLAWSMGVFAAEKTLDFHKITTAIAVNGTPMPYSDKNGIPGKIYDGTLENLSEKSLLKFQKRMAGKNYELLKGYSGNENIGSLKQQLEKIRKDVRSSPNFHDKEIRNAKWNLVFISDKDAIFPPANQKLAWTSHPACPEIRHISDYHLINFNHLFNSLFPSSGTLGKNFSNASEKYDDNAEAQRIIARNLAEMIKAQELNNTLEIGHGSGFLTKNLAEKIKINNATFIELYPVSPFGLFRNENYIVEDAEHLLTFKAEYFAGKFDAVFSASTIQWFQNLELFFKNASRILKPGGFLLCSTFLPGNIHELTSLNPYSLYYPSRGRIEEMLARNFSRFITFSEKITVKFDNARELLIHIKNTGTSGSAPSSESIFTKTRDLGNKLTYIPLYILAYK